MLFITFTLAGSHPLRTTRSGEHFARVEDTEFKANRIVSENYVWIKITKMIFIVNYFSLLKPEILRELVDLITSEPSKDVDEAEQYKYPNLACELLTSDLPALNERLVSEEILNKLYTFLQNEPPLNPLLSSYFSRTLSILISRKTEQVGRGYFSNEISRIDFILHFPRTSM